MRMHYHIIPGWGVKGRLCNPMRPSTRLLDRGHLISELNGGRDHGREDAVPVFADPRESDLPSPQVPGHPRHDRQADPRQRALALRCEPVHLGLRGLGGLVDVLQLGHAAGSSRRCVAMPSAGSCARCSSSVGWLTWVPLSSSSRPSLGWKVPRCDGADVGFSSIKHQSCSLWFTADRRRSNPGSDRTRAVPQSGSSLQS